MDKTEEKLFRLQDHHFVKVTLKRLWHGKADARDYVVENAKRNRMGICFIHEQDRRYVIPTEIGTGKVGTEVQAKFPLPNGKKTYNLISWNWKDLKEDPNEQDIQQDEFSFE